MEVTAKLSVHGNAKNLFYLLICLAVFSENGKSLVHADRVFREFDFSVIQREAVKMADFCQFPPLQNLSTLLVTK